jgi:hypothetical protein
MRRIYIVSLALCLSALSWNCKKDNNTPSTPVYTVPTTYNFANVDYSGQVKLLVMADQLVAAINLGNTSPNTVVSAEKLTDMFNNVNGYFNDSALKLNGSGLRLSDYCSAAAKADLLDYFDSIGVYSQSAAAAIPGTAGVAASSASPGKKFLLSPNGVFYSQVVKKTIMGGICAYKIQNVYLTDSIGSSVDNHTVIDGSGTALEHHWDEAFGLWGVPVNFPTVTSGLKYFGSYSNQVDAGLHSNTSIMNAFLKGRAAISAKDMNTMTAQANILISIFDSLDAAAIVQEMKETDANIVAGDAAATYGTLSEALGFVRNLKYNTNSKRVITSTQIAQLEALFDNVNPNAPNLYNFVGANLNSVAQIEAKTNAIRQFIGTVYGFNAAELLAL